MPAFNYIALGAGEGVVEAPDRVSAVRELVRRGLTPTRVTPARDLGAAAAGVRRRGPSLTASRTMSLAETAAFVRELAIAVEAGLPLVSALRALAGEGRPERQRRMIDSLVRDLERGRSLADAAESWGAPFSDLLVSLIRAGESSGRLGAILVEAARLLDRSVRLRRAVLAATLYPMILAALIAAAVVVVATFIVPRIVERLAGAAVHMPVPTRIVLGLADLVWGWWWAILALAAAAWWGLRQSRRSPGARLRMDRALLGVPLLGRVARDIATARFTRTFGTLATAGIPALHALRITGATLGNRALTRAVHVACDRVAAGSTIAQTLEESGLFPPMLVQLVRMGERSGRLDSVLLHAADAFDERSESSLKLLATALPPMLVVVMACAVGFVVLAVLLPLLELQEVILR
jgi:general secretion pathway protein F